jgi:uncharacterized repeat protein (TIGR03803 family)
MNTALPTRFFRLCALTGMLVGCHAAAPSDSMVPGVSPAAVLQSEASGGSFKTLYSFKGSPDGSEPRANLIVLSNVLYGTTYAGGLGAGSLFKMSLTGEEKVLLSFGSHDGEYPLGGVVALNGELYGTTSQFGPSHCGTVYGMNVATRAVKILHGFNCTDGGRPYAGLLATSTTLYGTTNIGGTGTNCSLGCGTVFAVDISSGKERTVYSFKGGTDGSRPQASLVAMNGTLYGTTATGGGATVCTDGCGTVFAVDATTGSERVLYRFKGGDDGATPIAGLAAIGDALYGTTSRGSGCLIIGSSTGHICGGTIFALTHVTRSAARARIIYRFKGGKDGAFPAADLLAVNGVLYGTTQSGGIAAHCRGCGTIFEVTTAGKERVLHTFTGGGGGAHPSAGLIELSGALYGTTAQGGSHCSFRGCGSVFTLAP